MNYKDIILSIKQKKIEPIYFLCGEESYFIDEITKTILKFTLTKEEKSFNQIVLYAKDTNTEEIISEAKQFPFGSKKKVVIIKEAPCLNLIWTSGSVLYKLLPNELTKSSGQAASVNFFSA
ncbi:MAG: hypothetical protein CMP69_02555, partial [Flavobacteriales bacterium]|nr:hypothetical protein [Flavobacteriales bacterium]